MKLPFHIYRAVKEPFAHHGCWHYMRMPSVPDDVRNRCFPGLIAAGEPGSGLQFLDFHRHMIRHFKWYTINTSGPRYDYRPWTAPPLWLSGVMEAYSPGYLDRMLASIQGLVASGDADDLGRFIEGSGAHIEPGLHGVIHGMVSMFEELCFGKQPLSDMGSQMTAPFNEHFWGLHGWIDGIYADWQRLRGDVVDQSPVVPHPHPPPMCPECAQATDKGTQMNPRKSLDTALEDRNR